MYKKFIAEEVHFNKCYYHQNRPGEFKIRGNEFRKTKYLCKSCYSKFKVDNPVLEKYFVEPVIELQNGIYGSIGEKLFKTKDFVSTKGKFGWQNWKRFGKEDLVQRGNSILGFYHLIHAIDFWENLQELKEEYTRDKKSYQKIGEYVYTVLGNPLFVLDSNDKIILYF